MPPYGRYNRRRRMVAVTPRKGKYTPRRKVYNKKPKVSFAAKVNKIIASNVENKMTATFTKLAPVGSLQIQPVGSVPLKVLTSFTWSPGNAGIFNLVQGTSIQDRIGNKIKIKRWIIKGLIQPNAALDLTPAVASPSGVPGFSQNSQVGYVDLYFGRLLANNTQVPSALTNFYQNGSVDLTPLGSSQEQLYRVNNDLYKVYYHRRFKMGTGNAFSGAGPTFAYTPSGSVSQSNDFSMTRSFGFDITKYILKNKMLSYDELISTPQNVDIENLTLWAIWHPAAGDYSGTPTTGPPTPTTSVNKTFYDINVMSYAEYEDA